MDVVCTNCNSSNLIESGGYVTCTDCALVQKETIFVHETKLYSKEYMLKQLLADERYPELCIKKHSHNNADHYTIKACRPDNTNTPRTHK